MQRISVRRLGIAAVLIVAALGARSHAQPAVVRAGQVWDVQVGADLTYDNLATLAFLPGMLTVQAGDTVRWTFAGVHSVTFDSGRPPLPYRETPGSEPGEIVFGPGRDPFGPVGPDVTYDGTQQLSSGRLTVDDDPYTLTFARPGMYAYYCILHRGMKGAVQVVSTATATTETPAQAQARGRAEGEAIIARLRADTGAVQTVRAEATPVAVHTVSAGLGNPDGGSALRFLPDVLSVRRGDVVVWTNPDAMEPHTVAFTSGATPPLFADVRPRPGLPPLIVITAAVAEPAGGTTYTGSGFVGSGILDNHAPYPRNSFALRIDAAAGVYEYVCLIHTMMKGTLMVSE